MRNRDLEQVKVVAAIAVMTAMSLIVALGGEPFGWVGVLFFGGGGLMFLFMYLASRRPPRPETAPPTRHGSLPGAHRYTAEPNGVVYPAKRGHLIAAVFGSAIFVLTGIAFLIFGFVIIGGLCVLVFGVFGAFGLRGAMSRNGGIALLPDGIFCRMAAGTAWMPWDAIQRVRVRSTSGHPYLAFRARAGRDITLTGLNRWLRRLNRRWFGMDVGYPVDALPCPAKEVCATIQRYQTDPDSRAALADPETA